MNYTYEFERVSAQLDGWGPILGSSYQMDDYQQVILARARDGWRYVGFVPAVQRSTGHIEEMDFVFEREQA